MTNQGLEISLMLIPAAQAAKKGVQVPSLSKARTYKDEGEQFFAPLSCYRSSKPLGKEQRHEKHYVLLHLKILSLLNGRKAYRRLWSNKLHQLLSTNIPTKGKMEQILVPQPPERKMEPWREISGLAISANHLLSNGFVISWIANVTGMGSISSNQRPRVEKWLPSNSNARELTIDLKFEIDWKHCIALVEFKSMSSPVEVQDAFILQINGHVYDLQPVGLILLLPNGKSLDEVFDQDHDFNRNQPSDWATINLQSGLVITAALRTRLRNGELVYGVDVDTKPSSSRRAESRGREKKVAKGLVPLATNIARITLAHE